MDKRQVDNDSSKLLFELVLQWNENAIKQIEGHSNCIHELETKVAGLEKVQAILVKCIVGGGIGLVLGIVFHFVKKA